MFRTRQGAVGGVFIAASVEEIVCRERQAGLFAGLPYGGRVEKNQICRVALGKAGEVVLGSYRKLEIVMRD